MKNKKGFTLVELIAIIIVIGLIIGILTPTAIRLIANSKKNAFREGMRSIVRSVEIYMEENNLRTLPEEGLFLSDEKLGLDYEDGYEGVIKYIDGEIVLENIHNGTYCGNGNLEDFNIVNYVPGECEVVKNVSKYDHCFVMGTTKVEGDTIVGYHYADPTCPKDVLYIPAEVNKVEVAYIDSLDNYDDTYEGIVMLEVAFFGENYFADIVTNIEGIINNGYLNSYFEKLGMPEDYYNEYFTSYDTELFMVPEDVLDNITKYCGNYNQETYYKDATYETDVTTEVCTFYYPVGNEIKFNEILERYHSENSSDATFSSINFDDAINLVAINEGVFEYGNISGELDMSKATKLEYIGMGAFYGNNIDYIELPKSIVEIDGYAFGYNYISEINFQDLPNLEYIRYGAFSQNVISIVKISNCTSLRVIEGDNGNDDYGAFEDNYINSIMLKNLPMLTNIGYTTDNYGAFYYNEIRMLELRNVPSLYTSGSHAFEEHNLEKITIPASVQELGYRAFYNDNWCYDPGYDLIILGNSYRFDYEDFEYAGIGICN